MNKIIRLLTIILLLAVVQTASAVDVSYIDENGISHNVEAVAIEGTETTLNSGWYVVNKNVNFNNELYFYGYVNLILADGVTMTMDNNGAGLAGIDFGGTFGIYGQKGQSGKLEIKTGGNGIRGGTNSSPGDFYLNGGIISIVANNFGINCRNLTINRGVLNVQSQEAPSLSNWQKIVINGGDVSCTGKIYADGGIILGCSNVDDKITAGGYTGSISITGSQVLIDNDNNLYFGTCNADDIDGKTLSRFMGITLPECMQINAVNKFDDVYQYKFSLKPGYTLTSDVLDDDDEPLIAKNDVFSVASSTNVVITAESKYNNDIESVDDLINFANRVNNGETFYGETIRLTADIDFGKSENDAPNFHAIGTSQNEFLGTFDGCGHSIKGMRVSGEETQGLFGYVGGCGTVKNVILVDANVSGDFYCGGIAGYITNNVYISDNLVIVATIEEGFGSGEIVGYNDGGLLSNNYYYNCTGASNGYGSRCYKLSLGEGVSTKSEGAGIFKYNGDYYCVKGAKIVLEYNANPMPYYFRFAANVDNVIDGEYILTMPDEDVNVSAKFDLEGEGTEVSPYLIKTPKDLRNLAMNVNDGKPDYADKHFLLVNDLDMSGVIYEPIGKNEDNPFSGIFDGGGNTISNINMTGRDEYDDQLHYGGIFGYCDNSTIKNVTLAKSTFYDALYCGGIVGDGNETTTVINCHVAADVSVSGNNGAGGIAGLDVNVYGCTSAAKVYGELEYAGGIVGANTEEGLTISNCLYLGTSVSGVFELGSIVSQNRGVLSNNFYTNYGLGGIGTSESNMYCHDEEGAAQYALTSTTQLAKIGNSGESYDEKAGITPYDYGLYYNGLYYFAPDLIIDGNSNNSVVISKQQDNQTVVFHRTFTEGIYTTIILPFDFTAAAFGNDEFYTFTGVDEKTWEATMTQVAPKSEDNVVHLNANTPYIFKPSAETAAKSEFVFTNVTIKPTTGENTTKVGVWEFHGTYEKMVWNTDDELETKNVYGFAATSETNREGKAIAAGEFVRAGYNVSIKPTRAYLEYKGTDDRLISKSALELPDRIKVVFIDKETASVIDDPTVNPSENENGDITTPTSEIQPTANVKVWSYDKTIFIQSRPGTDYCIIDANGRTLCTATTQTDRDEIRLGSRSGIAIVIIKGKTFKVIY